MKFINRDWVGPLIVMVLVLSLFGICATTTAKCWKRGGTVVKNVFDWPVCVEVKSK
jgi:hypothetical protein